MLARHHRPRRTFPSQRHSGLAPATRGVLAAALAALAAAACQDSRPPTGPEGLSPSALIVDGHMDTPLRLLDAIPGLKRVELTDVEYCCGAAGIYNLLEPDTSNAVLDPKLAHIAETGAALVATGNPGCLMQIGAGLRRAGSAARVVHPVQLLDASYAARVPSDA